MAPSPSGLHRILVVGGGAGGLELVTKLGDKLGRKNKAEVTLIERARTHVEAATARIAAGSMDADRHDSTTSPRHIGTAPLPLRRDDRARPRPARGAPRRHLRRGRRPITPKRSFTYDTLVLAIGSVTNDFGTPGVMEHAIMLDMPEQAERFNRRLVNALIRANTQDEPIRPGQLHVAIIGAGAPGPSCRPSCTAPRGVIAYGLDRIVPERDLKITRSTPRAILAGAARPHCRGDCGNCAR